MCYLKADSATVMPLHTVFILLMVMLREL